jgi:hypothetical protein
VSHIDCHKISHIKYTNKSINIQPKSHYSVISQLIRYSRDCGSYQDFLNRRLLLTRKLLNQGFLLIKLKSSLGSPLRNIGVTNDHVPVYVPLVVNTFQSFSHSWLITGLVTNGAGTAYPSGAPEFTPGF